MPLVMRMKAAEGEPNPLRKQLGDVVQLKSGAASRMLWKKQP